jgi:hypothetical protein
MVDQLLRQRQAINRVSATERKRVLFPRVTAAP